MNIERSDIVVRVNPKEAELRGITVSELTSKIISKGYKNVVVTPNCMGFGIESPKMSSLARAIFIGDIIQAANNE